ncbi:AbrB family transcriptional regulator [Halobacillus halophilus]|uniref:AbrB family transcriptional regulator n=1 Tax=Halobacillus halophilus TaxID=1570 RepID=UPI001CD50CE3|nr:AbrB family transcriptional regulator [Halobacillus halophilus]MCA1009395.1 AbrB family transcriptional regulator [Halobacillus halophilus]
MLYISIQKSILTYGLALIAGILFWLLKLPLPWILGPVAGLVLLKFCWNYETTSHVSLRNVAFALLGIQIGLTFTTQTFALVVPYFIPYTLLSLVLISLSMFLAYLISRKTAIDISTSLIGSAPGGLSAMMAVSESLKANTVLVTIFHTIRLICVLFIIPFAATHWFYQSSSSIMNSNMQEESLWTIAIYGGVYFIAYFLKSRIPAALVIVPMLIIGLLQSIGTPLYEMPDLFFVAAQIMIGVHLGHSVSINDIVQAGKYCLLYFGLAIIIIAIGIALGFLLSGWTGMDLVTAVLSLAPGGLVEMALTAQAAGGQPAIVSSLQMIRLLTIVIILPIFYQKFLPKSA